MNDNITFFLEEVEVDLDYGKVSLWLNTIAADHKSSIQKINYIFCNDEYLLDINRTHLNHDYYTDIITFPYKQGTEIESDIFISIDRVFDNAHSIGSIYEEELLRVIVHGLLHLVGYKDKTDEEAESMRSEENTSIAIYKSL